MKASSSLHLVFFPWLTKYKISMRKIFDDDSKEELDLAVKNKHNPEKGCQTCDEGCAEMIKKWRSLWNRMYWKSTTP